MCIRDRYIALSIETEISNNGIKTIKGLFEGVNNGMAMVDGYPVVLPKGVNLVGSKKKKKCKCKGLIVPNFQSPLMASGAFYVEVEGRINDLGIVTASKATLCRNDFGKPERELLASVNNNLSNETNPLQSIPADLAGANMNLYNGEVKVGQYSYKLTDDIKLQGYINQIGYKLLPKRVRKEQLNQGPVYYRFYVIEDPIPNAFAFPNGMIFVHTGILDIIENEAQLAAVLGHEIAHVTHEHGRERYETNMVTGLVKVAGETLLKETSLTSRLSAAAPGLPMGMVNTISDLSNAITPAGISNIVKPQTKMEAQADRVGLFYAYQAGYDIREAAKFWNKMAELTGDQSFQSKLTTDLMGSLQARLSYSNGNMIASLSSVGTDVLAKQVLDTIYTSHPKAKKRARAVNELVSSVYTGTDWEKKKVKEAKYLEKMGN